MIWTPEAQRSPGASQYRGKTHGEAGEAVPGLFGKDQARNVTDTVMDMGRPSRMSFPGRCPNGLLYDMFHVLRHLLEAVTELRKQELKRLRGALKGLLSGMKSFLPAR